MSLKNQNPLSDHRLPGSLRAVLPTHRNRASALVEELGIDLDEASLQVRKRFETAIVASYRKVFEDSLKARSSDRVGLALKLAKDKGTRSRWERGEREPDWDSLFLGLAAFNIDIGPDIPRGREIVIQAIRVTVPELRSQYLDMKQEVLSRDQVVCLHYVTQSRAWSLARETESERHWETALDQLQPLISRAARGLKIGSREEISSRIAGWILPWSIFHYLVPHDWHFSADGENDATDS